MTSKTDQATGPLAGVRVLDLSRILAGPTCTQLLGDYGADILKIERPGAGDDTRQWAPPYVMAAPDEPTQESAYYLAANRNKQSVALDISSPEGAEKIRELALHCDVVVENFKIGGLKKYGLDFASLKAINPKLVYCSITGFGQTGPNAQLPGYDIMAQGYGGIMSLTGEPDGQPVKVGVGNADVMCGMYACTAILAALHHQRATGDGQHIDIALVDAQIAWLVNEGTNYLTSGKAPVRRGNQHPNIAPYQSFEARDGHLIVAVGNDSQYQRFCALLGHPELATDPRFVTNMARLNHRVELVEALRPIIAGFNKSELLTAMKQSGVPGGPINTLPEVFASDQVEARDMKITVPHSQAETGDVTLIGNPVKFSETPATYRMGPPTCGEHTNQVLDWLQAQ